MLPEAYLQAMPRGWRHRWDDYATMQNEDIVLLAIQVVGAVKAGTINLQEAGAILSPLSTHPVSVKRSDGELVALGLFADELAQGSSVISKRERDYLWGELVACLRRLKSA